MLKLLVCLIAGALFGVGLALAGMTNPVKVQNFLDVAGTWDPSLAFVMGGAVMVTLVAFALVLKRAKPWLAEHFWHWLGFDGLLPRPGHRVGGVLELRGLAVCPCDVAGRLAGPGDQPTPQINRSRLV